MERNTYTAHIYRDATIARNRCICVWVVGVCCMNSLFCCFTSFCSFFVCSFHHSFVDHTPLHTTIFFLEKLYFSSLFVHFVLILSFSLPLLAVCAFVLRRNRVVPLDIFCACIFSMFDIGSYVGKRISREWCWRMFRVYVVVISSFGWGTSSGGSRGSSSSGLALASRNWFTVKQLHHLVLECWERSIRCHFFRLSHVVFYVSLIVEFFVVRSTVDWAERKRV